MLVTDSDKQFYAANHKALFNALDEYQNLTGKIFPPFNYEEKNFDSLEAWSKHLLAEIDRLKQA